jgi:DNA-binding MarR family transcriptional regulator
MSDYEVKTSVESNDELFEHIEHAIAVFVRRAEATRIGYLNYKDFDRSTYLLLLQLQKKGPLGIKALADIFQLDLSTLSRQTASLESKGFVERKYDPNDARVNLLRITPKGAQQLQEVKQARQAFYARLLADWSEEESRSFGQLLQKFNETVESYRSPK